MSPVQSRASARDRVAEQTSSQESRPRMKDSKESPLAIRRRKGFTDAEVQAILDAAWSMGLTERS